MRINFQTLNIFPKYEIRKNNNNLNSSLMMTSPLSADKFERTSNSLAEVSFLGKTNKKHKSVNPNGETRKTTNFDVKKIHNIECPVCEKITMDEKDIEEYKRNVANKKGQELVDAIDKYGDEYYWTGEVSSRGKTVYRENVEGILAVVKRLALENPNDDLKAIVRRAAKDAMPDLVGKQLNVLGEIEAYAVNNIRDKAQRENVFKLTDKHRDIILDRKPGVHFKRKTFLNDISQVKVYNSDIKKEMQEIAKKLPASTNDESSFFVKYATDPDRGVKEIAGRFVYENRATGEHVDCFSDGGVSDKSNYFCDCAYCNSTRGDTPFKIWARTIPHFQDNLQKYLDTVQLNINNHELGENYADYPEQIIKTIEKQSGGEIKLMHPKEHLKMKSDEVSLRVKQKQEEQRIANDKEYQKLNEELEQLKAKASNSYSEAARLSNKLRTADTNEKQELKRQIKEQKALQDRLKAQIDDIKEQMKPYKNKKSF